MRYQAVYHITALNHTGFLSAPKGRVEDCCRVSCYQTAEKEVSDSCGSAGTVDPCSGRSQDSKEGSVGPEGNGVGAACTSVLKDTNLSLSY